MTNANEISTPNLPDPTINQDNAAETKEDEIDHEAIMKRQSVIRSSSLNTHDYELLTRQNSTKAESNLLLRQAPVYKFVLTGGPCGGKTTSLARLSSYLRERGFEVFTVPEAFTLLSSNGFSFDYFAIHGMDICVQNTVMDLQMSLEDSFERVLRAKGKPGVILCDRGLMDGSAYMDSKAWDGILAQRGLTSAEIREGRYNAVFHLVTAAEGAERYYTLENNEARTETPDEARRQDELTRRAWVGHPNLMILDNRTDFEGKLNKLVNVTSKLVGLPTTVKDSTVKFLLRERPDLSKFPEDIKYNIFDVEKVYLYDDDQTTDSNYKEEYSFIRKRSHVTQDGKPLGTTYGLTTVKITRHDQKQVEVKRIISAREYNTAYKARDVSRHIVKQKRISFLYKMQSFNVHIFIDPEEDLCIVHAQTPTAGVGRSESGTIRTISEENFGSNDGDNNNIGENSGDGDDGPVIHLPPFLNVERRLENDGEDAERYGAFNISLKEKH